MTHGDLDDAMWQKMLAYLRQQHPAICRQWFDELEPVGAESGEIFLRAQSNVHRDYLRRQCGEAFTEAGQNVTGQLSVVRFLGPEDEIPASRDRAEAPLEGVGKPDTLAINPDYHFDSFIVGPSNRYPEAAARAVSDNPGNSYNPLFIYGGVGLGKTHLLQAICLNIMDHTPDAEIQYLSCESFVSHFTEAIRANQMSQFRHWFRDTDVLVIDDIHFLAARERSQEEFFHTFNTLYQANKQIVLSSDAPPEEIPDLEDRLVSRFKWGLVTQVEPPDFDTRVAIVQAKAKQRSMDVDHGVASLIAQRVTSNIRELEGAVTKLHIYTSVERITHPTMEVARAALGDEPVAATSGPTIPGITEVVTDYYNIRLTDLQSKKRHRSITLPRQLCMYLARQHTRHSLEEIGHYFGGRDHTTVMHAVKTVASRRTDDTDFDVVVKRLETKLV